MQVTFGVSVHDIVAHAVYQAEHSKAYRRDRAAQEWIIALLLGFFILLGGITRNVGLVVFSLSLLGVALVVIPRSHGWAVARMTRALIAEGENRGVLGKHTLEITPEAVVDTTQYTSSKVLWSAVEGIDTTEEYAFIHTGAKGGHAIPKRVFSDETDFEQFVATAREYHQIAQFS